MSVVALALFATLQTSTTWVEAPTPADLAEVEIRSVVVEADGSVWFGVRDRGLAHFDGARVRWVSQSDGLVSTGVSDLLIDRAGDLWASGLGGYSVLREGRWRSSARLGSLAPRVVYSLGEDSRSGAIWMSGNVGAGRLLEGRWQVFDSSAGLPHMVVHAAHSDARGATWFACRTGLARLEGAELEVMFPTTNFRSIVEGPDGRLWFGTSDGVLSWDGTSWTHELRGRPVYPRLVASDGSIWAGSASTGAFRYADGAWAAVELPEAFAGAEVFDLDEGTDGSIWIATAVGALRLRSTQAGGPN